MADVHLLSAESISRSHLNPMSSLFSTTTSPLPPPLASTFFLNSFPECLPDPMAPLPWQHIVPDQQIPISCPLPSLNPALAFNVPEMGYDSSREITEGALLREIAFTLDAAKENNTLHAAMITAPPYVAAPFSTPEYKENPQKVTSFCNGSASQLGEFFVGTPDKLESTVIKEEHMKAFSPLSTAAESGGMPLEPSSDKKEEEEGEGEEEEEEHVVSCSSGHNAVIKPSAAMKKRKPVEELVMDVPSCITFVQQEISKKSKSEKPKTKGHKSSESKGKAEEPKKKADSNNSANSAHSKQMHTKESARLIEPPKQDFIHVRARRGQATDSHSLAERVRREKISHRMKFLQDLVPGCSKISGKAVMLDEIINYVQSLQQQVEFLSMKLEALNSRPNISLEGMFVKEMLQGYITPSPYGFDQELLPSFSFITSAQAKLNQLGGSCADGLDSRPLISPHGNNSKRNSATILNGHIFRDDSQISSVWDELQNPIQIGF